MSGHSNGTLLVKDHLDVTLEYRVALSGEGFNNTEKPGIIQFIQGCGQVFPALEKEIYGMKCGDSKEILITAADAFGEIDPDDLIELPRTEFPRNLLIKAGDILHYQVEPGDEFEVGVMTADEKTVRLNLGHPLAGKDLIYWVKVIDVREVNEKDCAAGSVYPGIWEVKAQNLVEVYHP